MFIAFVNIVLFSCITKYQDIDMPEIESKLVVSSFFAEDEQFRVNISSSLGRNTTDEYTPVTNASVNLFENDQWVEELVSGVDSIYKYGDSIGKLFYYSKITLPKAGSTYKIQVAAPGFDPVSAESKVPKRTALRVIDTTWVEIDLERFLRVKLEMYNPPEKQWFYIATAQLCAIFSDDGSLDPKIIGYTKFHFTFRVIDPIIGKRERRIKEDFPVFSNELIPGNSYNFSIEVDQQDAEREKFVIDLATLSDEAYQYLTTITEFKNNDIRYSEPIKIYSNISGGYGIFAGINVACDTITFRQY